MKAENAPFGGYVNMPLWEVGTFLGFCPVVVAPEAAGLTY